MTVEILVSHDLLSKAVKNEAMDDLRQLLKEAGVECDMRQRYQYFKKASSRKKSGAIWR